MVRVLKIFVVVEIQSKNLPAKSTILKKKKKKIQYQPV